MAEYPLPTSSQSCSQLKDGIKLMWLKVLPQGWEKGEKEKARNHRLSAQS